MTATAAATPATSATTTTFSDARRRARDPTGTSALRRAWRSVAELRLRQLRAQLRVAVVDHDMLGLAGGLAQYTPAHQRLMGFQGWFENVAGAVLGGGWPQPYAKAAWQSGHAAAMRETGKAATLGQHAGEHLAELARAEFAGIAAALSQRVARAATDAVTRGQRPSRAYAEMVRPFDRQALHRVRANVNVIAVKAHNEAKLAAYREMGVARVGVEPEASARRARRVAAFDWSPDQPREPAGSPEGGQWTSGGGSGARAEHAEPSLGETLRRAAREHYGLTSNPAEAGYVMPDGSMLDFSGRHQMGNDYRKAGDRWVPKPARGGPLAGRSAGIDYQAGRRDVDHRDLPDEVHDQFERSGAEGAGGGGAADQGLGGSAAMRWFMRQTGAARWFPGVGVEFAGAPTDRQIAAAVAGHNRWVAEHGRDDPRSTPELTYGAALNVDLDAGGQFRTKAFERPTFAAVKTWVEGALGKGEIEHARPGGGALPETAKLAAAPDVVDITGEYAEGEVSAVSFLTPQGRVLGSPEAESHTALAEGAGTTIEKLLAEGTARIYLMPGNGMSEDELGIYALSRPTAQQIATLAKTANANCRHGRFVIEGSGGGPAAQVVEAPVTAGAVRKAIDRAFPPERAATIEHARTASAPRHEKEFLTVGGEPAYAAVVDDLDGAVLEAVRYEKARDADFHHHFFLRPETLRRMDMGEAVRLVWGDRQGLQSMEPMPHALRLALMPLYGRGERIEHARPAELLGHGYSRRAKLVGGAVHTSDVRDAVRALWEGRRVELTQPRQASTLIDKLGEVSKRMIAQGRAAPNFNLCDVSVRGSNLFCADAKGIPRVKMPQIKDAKAFRRHLERMGVAVEKGREEAKYLRATQSELNGAKVAAIAAKMRAGKVDPEDARLFVSRDNYIVDGHHRWAAAIGVDAEDNRLGDVRMRVARVDMDIIGLLREARKFSGGAKGFGDALTLDWSPDQPREPAGSPEGGQWTSAGGAGAKGGEFAPVIEHAKGGPAIGGGKVGAAWRRARGWFAPLSPFNASLAGGQQALSWRPPPLKLGELRKVGPQMGSNLGGVYEDKGGRRFYLKKGKTPDHARNERLAAALYRLAGTPTMRYRDVEGGGWVATEIEKLDKDNAAAMSEAERREAKRDFAAHAWLADWDVVGTGGGGDNLVVIGGRPVPVDVGGALEYRAQGGPKGEAFGDEVGELDTLRDPAVSKLGPMVFGDMTPAELRESALSVARVRDDDIREAVRESGSPPALAEKLIRRRDDVARRMKNFGAEGDPRSPDGTAVFSTGEPLPAKRLNGIAFRPWAPPADWNEVGGQRDLGEAPLPENMGGGRQLASGLIIREPDGRVWLARPSRGFGGVMHTYPKGRVEPELSLQANAIKEAWEETGIKARVVGLLGDRKGGVTTTRYYLAEREAGDPRPDGRESDGSVLAPVWRLGEFLNQKRDLEIAWELETGGEMEGGDPAFSGRIGGSGAGAGAPAPGRAEMTRPRPRFLRQIEPPADLDQVAGSGSEVLPGGAPNRGENRPENRGGNRRGGNGGPNRPENRGGNRGGNRGAPARAPGLPRFEHVKPLSELADWEEVGVTLERFRADAAAGQFDYDALHGQMTEMAGDLPERLDAEHRAAVALWTQPSGYKLINDHLRGKHSSAKAAAAVKALDEAIAASRLTHRVVAWRGIHGPQAARFAKLRHEDAFFAKGYTALTVDPRRATHYGGKDALILVFHLPEGASALYTSNPKIGSWGAERELLLPRGTKFEYRRSETIKVPTWGYAGDVENPAPREFRVTHVAVLPPEWPGGLQVDRAALADKTQVTSESGRGYWAPTGPGSRVPRGETPSASTIRRIERAQERLEEEVGDLVGVETAGDELVCDDCEEIAAGGPYSLDEAQGLIPAHVNCRCAFVPWLDQRFARDAALEAAGVMFVAPGGRVLFVRRADGEGWAFPAGGVEEGEEPRDAAMREAAEEVGWPGDWRIEQVDRRTTRGVDFRTFLQPVAAEFEPLLNEEHDARAWALPGDAPAPLHPGVAATLAALGRVGAVDWSPDQPREPAGSPTGGQWTSAGGGGEGTSAGGTSAGGIEHARPAAAWRPGDRVEVRAGPHKGAVGIVTSALHGPGGVLHFVKFDEPSGGKVGAAFAPGQVKAHRHALPPTELEQVKARLKIEHARPAEGALAKTVSLRLLAAGAAERPAEIEHDRPAGAEKFALKAVDPELEKAWKAGIPAYAKAVEKKCREVALLLNMDPDKVSVSSDVQITTMGATAASTSDETGEVVMFAQFCDPRKFAGILAHELEHIKYRQYRKAYKAEKAAVDAELAAMPEAERAAAANPDGTLNGALAEKYRLYQEFTQVYDVPKLREEDGVSGYSKSWWARYDASGGQHWSRSCVHETLAEMARINLETGELPGGPRFQALYGLVRSFWHERRPPGYHA